EIKEYIRDAARGAGALERLHTGSWVENADWNSERGLYRVTCRVKAAGSGDAETTRIVWARRVHYGSGYYSHSEGYRPEFPGRRTSAARSSTPSSGQREWRSRAAGSW